MHKLCRIGIVGMNASNFPGTEDDNIDFGFGEECVDSQLITKIKLASGPCHDRRTTSLLKCTHDSCTHHPTVPRNKNSPGCQIFHLVMSVYV